jgi:large subunit ribosomal protein L21
MLAVVITGGKQYKVQKGDTIKVEKLDAKEGEKVEFTQVVLTANGDDTTIGTPLVAGAKVTGKVKSQDRADKIRIVKFQSKKRHKSIQGHRQAFTEVEITDVKVK